MYNPNSLGIFLRSRRKELGLTISDLSNKIALSTSTISHVETGKFQSPSTSVLEKFGAIYNIPAIDLAKMIDIPTYKTKEYISVPVVERNRSVEMLRNFVTLEWTAEQEKKLAQVFALLDEVTWECEREPGKRKELNAITGSRFTIERVVAAFSIKHMIEKEGGVVNVPKK